MRHLYIICVCVCVCACKTTTTTQENTINKVADSLAVSSQSTSINGSVAQVILNTSLSVDSVTGVLEYTEVEYDTDKLDSNGNAPIKIVRTLSNRSNTYGITKEDSICTIAEDIAITEVSTDTVTISNITTETHKEKEKRKDPTDVFLFIGFIFSFALWLYLKDK